MRYIHFPKDRCPSCLGTRLGWEEVPRTARLATFTEVHRTFAPGFEDDVPYIVGVAELDVQPGLRVIANLTRSPSTPPRLWAPVVVEFAHRPGFGAVPALRIVDAAC